MFVLHVHLRLMAKLLHTHQIPVPGLLGAIKRILAVPTGWRMVPEISPAQVSHLLMLAGMMRVSALPADLDLAAEQFVEAGGDPVWADYDGELINTPNAVRNYLTRITRETNDHRTRRIIESTSVN